MRTIILLAGATMVASWFLTWAEPPFAGAHVSPHETLLPRLGELGPEADWRLWAFLGSFVAALLASLAALTGRGAGPWATLAGALPVAVVGATVHRVDDLRRDLGLPVPVDLGDMASAMEVLDDFLRLGLWAYLGAALVLLVAGLSALLAPRR